MSQFYDRMKNYFGHGYDSGTIEKGMSDPLIRQEFEDSGGNYTQIFNELIRPRIPYQGRILEIGPGKGSWTRAVVNHMPKGQLIAVDVLDLGEALKTQCKGHEEKIVFHQITDNCYDRFEDETFDFAFSMGVFVHLSLDMIAQVLANVYPKIKPGGRMIIHYSNWDKLEEYGWERGRVPLHFKDAPEASDTWWIKNTCNTMAKIIQSSGFHTEAIDTNHMERDSIAILRRS